MAKPRQTLKTASRQCSPHVSNTVLQFLARKVIKMGHTYPTAPWFQMTFYCVLKPKKELKGQPFPTSSVAVKTLEAILIALSK